MTINNNFKFQTMLSCRGYQDKTDAVNSLGKVHCSKKMAFKPYTVTLDNFADYVLNGYSYCGIFEPKAEEWIETKNYKTGHAQWKKVTTHYTARNSGQNKDALKIQFKSDKYFKGSQVVSIDVDETHYTDIQEYIEKLTFKPSFVYCSFSDTAEKRKFRLIYVFADMLNGNEFEDVSKYLHSQSVLDMGEIIKDKCGIKKSQYFNGTNKTENYRTYNVYTKDEVIQTYRDNLNNVLNNSINKSRENKCNMSSFLDTCGQKRSNVSEVLFNEELIRDIKKDDYKTIIKKYQKKYKYFYRTEKTEWITTEEGYKYQYTDENYLELFVPKAKVKDGEHRKRKLYERACLRRIIKNETTPSEMLYNLYIDRNKYFDNSDGTLTIARLIDTIKSAYKKTIEELTKEFADKLTIARKNNPTFIVYNYGEMKDKATRANTIKKAQRKLAKTGKTKYDMAELLKLYNPNLSIRKNIEEMEKQGIKVSRGKMLEVSNEYKKNNISNNNNDMADNTIFKPSDSISDGQQATNQQTANNAVTEPQETADYNKTNKVIADIVERCKQPFADNDLISIATPLLDLLRTETNAELKEYQREKLNKIVEHWQRQGLSDMNCNVILKVANNFFAKAA